MWQIGRQLPTSLTNVHHHQNTKLKEMKRKTTGYFDQSVNPLKLLPTNKHYYLPINIIIYQ